MSTSAMSHSLNSQFQKLSPKEKGALFGLIIIGVLVVAGFIWNILTMPLPPDEYGCPATGPVANYIMVVDRTGEIPQSAQRAIRTNIETIINKAPVGTRISLYEIDSQYMRGLSSAKFTMCKMRDGSHADSLTENAEMLKRTFREKFQEPFMSALNDALVGSSQKRSPILEAMVDATSVEPFQIPAPTTIYLFSDMLQNSDEYSQYKVREHFDAAVQRSEVNRLIPSLAGVEVKLFYMLRVGKELKMQTNDHVQFWLDYFQAANAEIQGIKKIR